MIFLLSFLALLSACSSTTEKGDVNVERRQLLVLPSGQIESMSQQAYEQVKNEAQAKNQLDRDPVIVGRLQTIMNRLVPQTPVFRKDARSWKWEVHLISSPELNAYCMPGGKIMFYSGIIQKLALTDDEIAAIMGHEMAHALREHGRERMSEALIQNIGLEILGATNTVSRQNQGVLQMVSSLAITLPNGRTQETEADRMGLELMARAGFQAAAPIQLWTKMSAQGGQKPPEILSTHPSDETRIRNLEKLVAALPAYK